MGLEPSTPTLSRGRVDPPRKMMVKSTTIRVVVSSTRINSAEPNDFPLSPRFRARAYAIAPRRPGEENKICLSSCLPTMLH